MNSAKDACAWNGPISQCAICGTSFGYIDSGNSNGTGRYWFPRDRCSSHGGDYVTYEPQVGGTLKTLPVGSKSVLVDYEAIRRVIQRLRTFGMVESARELEVAIGEGEK